MKLAMRADRSCSVVLDMWRFRNADEVRALAKHAHASRVTWVVHTISDSLVLFLEFPDAPTAEAFAASPGDTFKGLLVLRPAQAYLDQWTTQ